MRPLAALAILIFFPVLPALSQGPYGSALCPAQVPYDVQFLDTLMQHNRDAVVLMELAQSRARSSHVRAVAQHILFQRRSELPALTQIRRRVGGYLPPVVNYGMPGMVAAESEWARLSTLPADQFDRAFLASAVMVQQAGVRLCEDALGKARDPSVRALAAQIRSTFGDSVVVLQRLFHALS